MPAEYTLNIDRAANLISFKGRGFFDVETFTRVREEGYAAARGLSGDHLTFADLRECTVQNQDILALAQGLFLNSPVRAKRVAIVISGVLQRMQARRVKIRDGMEVFEDPCEARAWLETGDDG